jgi:glycosyltransferase involved in cell wall biosynthesis
MRSVTAVVLPSLNEESNLKATSESLGFCEAQSSQQSTNLLFIIDNGSTDGTLEVAREIQHRSGRNSVFIAQEPERGYVPPRHTGNMLVKAFAEQKGLDLSDVLVLQADADTIYAEGYVDRMSSASTSSGQGYLLEGYAEFPQSFRTLFPEYVNLCAGTDDRVLTAVGAGHDILVCTDAVSGYLLSDYFAWGGHLREYRKGGDEIHAETMRLYMRALAHGARKVYVGEALAYPSERKVLSRAVEEFATGGFPREISWKTRWEQQHRELSLADFRMQADNATIMEAIDSRERHLVALFGVLPIHVARTIGESIHHSSSETLVDIATSLPKHETELLRRHPGAFLEDVLDLVDDHSSALTSFLKSGARR